MKYRNIFKNIISLPAFGQKVFPCAYNEESIFLHSTRYAHRFVFPRRVTFQCYDQLAQPECDVKMVRRERREEALTLTRPVTTHPPSSPHTNTHNWWRHTQSKYTNIGFTRKFFFVIQSIDTKTLILSSWRFQWHKIIFHWVIFSLESMWCWIFPVFIEILHVCIQ